MTFQRAATPHVEICPPFMPRNGVNPHMIASFSQPSHGCLSKFVLSKSICLGRGDCPAALPRRRFPSGPDRASGRMGPWWNPDAEIRTPMAKSEGEELQHDAALRYKCAYAAQADSVAWHFQAHRVHPWTCGHFGLYWSGVRADRFVS